MIREIGERHGFDSAPWAFAARWATDWLQRAQRMAPPPMRPAAVLVGDATRDDLDPDALALKRCSSSRCAPAPACSSCRSPAWPGSTEVLGAFAPQVVVIAGAHASDDDVARWAYRVRAASGALPMTLYRRGGRADAARTTARILPDSAGEAHRARARHSRWPAAGAWPLRLKTKSHSRMTAVRWKPVSERPRLVALPGHGDRPRPDVHSAGTAAPAAEADIQPASRVCARCGLGLLVSAPPTPRRRPQDPFLLVDGQLSICAVSRLAEQLLLTSRDRGGQLAHRRPARAGRRRDRRRRSRWSTCSCTRPAGAGETHHVVLRPAKEFGIRFWARIGPCGPPRAALVVLADGRA